MMMLDALSGLKPKRRPRFTWIAAFAVLVLSLGAAAIPEMRPAKQEGASALEEVLTSGKRSKDIRSIVERTNAYLKFSKDITRVAVGDEKILELSRADMSKRELTLFGNAVGRTSLTLWYEDQTNEQFMFAVQRDLSVLDAALKNVHSSINVEIAPDRDAIVLSGTVPDSSHSIRAEEVALQYLSAGGTKGQQDMADVRNTGQVINLIQVQNPAATLESRLQSEIARLGARNVTVRRVSQGSIPSDLDDVFILEGTVDDMRTLMSASSLAAKILPGTDLEAKEQRIVNQMSTKDRSSVIEGVIQGAIHDLGYRNVRVRRVVQAEFPGDADILVLEGSVPTQTALLQTLTLASKVFLQQELVKTKREKRNQIIETDPNGTVRVFYKDLKLPAANEDIQVVGDEGGGLKSDRVNFFGGASGSALSSILGAGGGQNASGSFLRLLSNQIGTNIGRAKALEIANGRILSFLSVDDLPQVRIDIKLYEINRTALLSWNSEQSAIVSDFNRPSQLRPEGQILLDGNGDPIVDGNGNPIISVVPTDNADFQNAVSFLGGMLSNVFQVSGDHVDIDSLLSLLETEGIARSLSSPSLTVLSGELAFFGVGGTVPIQSSIVTDFGSGEGGTSSATSGIFSTTVERDFGIRLAVRPLVDEDDMITLDVIPSVSNPDADLTRLIRDSTGTEPTTVAFQERSLRTSARLRDGQTLLIGGLTERSRTDDSSQTPGLHKVPLLGYLFKGFSYADGDRELVIIVNPVIMRDAPKSAPIWAFPDVSELTAPKTAEARQSERGGQ